MSFDYSQDEAADIFVEADKTRLTQVISNLLNNVTQFTEEGTISVRTIKDETNNQIVINIKDSGSGIRADIVPKLFTKFISGSSQGTGLGLFISKSIIESHGGRIWAQNNIDGKGATFSFSLPIAR